mgnify:CR=1 FL=1
MKRLDLHIYGDYWEYEAQTNQTEQKLLSKTNGQTKAQRRHLVAAL